MERDRLKGLIDHTLCIHEKRRRWTWPGAQVPSKVGIAFNYISTLNMAQSGLQQILYNEFKLLYILLHAQVTVT